MSAFEKPNTLPLLRRAGVGLNAGIALVAGLLVTALAVTHSVRSVEEEQELRFNRLANQVSREIMARLQGKADLLQGMAGHYSIQPGTSRAQHGEYVRRFPRSATQGVTGYGFARLVPRSNLGDFLARSRGHGAAPLGIKGDQGTEPDLFIIEFAEPEEANRAVLGFDIGAEPVRRRAALEAVARVDPVMSARLAALPGEATPGTLLLLQAVFDRHDPPLGYRERWSHLIGWVYASLDPGALFASLGVVTDGMVTVRLRDNEVVLLDWTIEHATDTARPFVAEHKPREKSVAISVGGRDWEIDLRATDRFASTSETMRPFITAFTGLLLSLAAAGLAGSARRSRERAGRMAAEMSADARRSEETAKAALARLARQQALIETHSLVAGIDHTGTVRYLNEGLAALLCVDVAAVDGTPAAAFLADSFDRRRRRRLRVALAKTGLWRGELIVRSRDGARHSLETTLAATTAPGPGEHRYLLIATDVTAIRDTSFRLAHQHRLLNIVLSATGGGIFDINLTNGQCFFSAEWRTMMGYSAHEDLTEPAHDPARYHPDDRERVLALLDTLARGAQSAARFEARHRRKDGSYRWIAASCGAFRDPRDKSLHVAGIHVDIDERKTTDAAMRELQARHARALAGSSDAIWEHLYDSDRVHVADRFREILGLPDCPDTLEAIRALVHPDDLADYLRHTNHMIESAGAEEWEARFRTGGGDFRWLRVRGRVIRDDLNRPYMRAGTFSDIHEQRMAREQLRALQARYERALDGANDVVWERDLATGELFLSERYKDMMGVGADQVPTTIESVFANMHPEDLPEHVAHVKRMLEGREVVTWEVRLRVGDGSHRWFRVRGRCLVDESGKPWKTSGTLSDVHEARAAVERLKEVQARLERALKGSSDAIWERQLDSDAFHMSARFAEILGYPEAELPVTRAQFVALIHPEDLPGHMREVENMLGHDMTARWECRFRTRDGDYRWLRISGSTVRNARGEPVMTSGTAGDIHEAKCAAEELKQHRDHLARMVEQRTAGLSRAMQAAETARRQAEQANLSKSEFLANMSHELRTPMHAIKSFSGMGIERSRGPGMEKLARYFVNIESSATRLKRLLDDLLDLSKIEAGKMQYEFIPADLPPIVRQVATEFEAMARTRNVRLDVAVSGTLPHLRLDAARIQQVIANLVSNAIKFTLEGSRVELLLGPAPDGQVQLVVSDRGPGIPEAELEAVFEKFVQSSLTKTGAGGTGLGLAITREIVVAHGGRIAARNRADGGAVFELLLPAPAGDGAAEPAAPVATTESAEP